MSFKEIESDIKLIYDSTKSDIVNDFFNKVLSESVRYDHISGLFNPISIAAAARGMDKFVNNEGHMRLLCGALLDEEDLKSINNDDLKKLIDQKFLEEYKSLDDDLIEDYIKVLGWMLANGCLEIKIGVHKASDGSFTNGMFHTRIGIMYDELGDSILFSASNSEMPQGWRNNIEFLKVFCSWENPEYIEDDKKDFETFWNNLNPYLYVFDVPELTKKKLKEIAPKSREELEDLLRF